MCRCGPLSSVIMRPVPVTWRDSRTRLSERSEAARLDTPAAYRHPVDQLAHWQAETFARQLLSHPDAEKHAAVGRPGRGVPDFRFPAKLWQGFTHEGRAGAQDETAFRQAMAPCTRRGALEPCCCSSPTASTTRRRTGPTWGGTPACARCVTPRGPFRGDRSRLMRRCRRAGSSRSAPGGGVPALWVIALVRGPGDPRP